MIHLAVLFGYLLLTAVMTWPLVTQLTTAIPGDGFDGWQNYWNLWWIKVALVEKITNPLITDMLYHPTGVSLYFHTLNPINSLITLPVQLNAGLIPAYNAVVFIAWVLSGYGVFLLTRWVLSVPLTADQHGAGGRASTWRFNAAAFLAGAVYTFAPFHMAHLLGHMQVMSIQWMPFYILYLLRSLRAVQLHRSWLRDALLAGFFLILVGLSDWYFVLYLLIFTGLLLLWLRIWIFVVWFLKRRRGESDDDKTLLGSMWENIKLFILLLLPPLVAGLLFLVVLMPALAPMLREIRAFEFMVRPATDLYILSASAMDFLVPNRLHTLFQPEAHAWIGNQIAPVSERTIGIGYAVLLLALLAAIWKLRRAALWIATACFFFLLALGPVIHVGNITWDHIPTGNELPLNLTPLGVLAYFLPIVRMSRSVSRYALMVQLSLSVLAGLGMAALLERVRDRRVAGLIAAGVLAVILFEYWVAPFPMSPPDTPTYYNELATNNVQEKGAVLNLPMNYDRPGYLLYQTVHKQPLTVAYISRNDPRTLTERAPVLQHFRHLGPDILDVDPVAVGMTVLSDLDVDKVILDRYKMPDGLEREYTTELATAIFADIAPDYEDDRLTAYAVQPPERSQPYPLLGELNWGPLIGDETEEIPLARQLLGNEVKLYLRHLPADAQLRLRYRTAAAAPLTLHLPDETVSLPASETAVDATIDLGVIDLAEAVEIILQPAAPGQAWVESVGLVLP